MARISTHILDVAKGKPAAGVTVELYFGGQLVGSAKTNADGRTDEPLLIGERIATGAYELLFHAGDSLFFSDIAVRFNVTKADENYHVPLLLAPYGYSTYRGS
jgi:5-hydroxyisourate hydrolase